MKRKTLKFLLLYNNVSISWLIQKFILKRKFILKLKINNDVYFFKKEISNINDFMKDEIVYVFNGNQVNAGFINIKDFPKNANPKIFHIKFNRLYNFKYEYDKKIFRCNLKTDEYSHKLTCYFLNKGFRRRCY